MNLLENYVTNITSDKVITKEFDGKIVVFHELVADVDCYGYIEKQKKFRVTEEDYQSIKGQGFYLG